MVLTENSVFIRTAEVEMNRQVRCQTGFFNGGSGFFLRFFTNCLVLMSYVCASSVGKRITALVVVNFSNTTRAKPPNTAPRARGPRGGNRWFGLCGI